MTSWEKYKNRLLHPNGLSIVRGLIGLSLPFLILRPNPAGHWVALTLFIVGAITDYFDGWVARQYKLESPFGRWIDPFSDKILILGPLAAFAMLKFYSIWWVVPIFAREILVTLNTENRRYVENLLKRLADAPTQERGWYAVAALRAIHDLSTMMKDA